MMMIAMTTVLMATLIPMTGVSEVGVHVMEFLFQDSLMCTIATLEYYQLFEYRI